MFKGQKVIIVMPAYNAAQTLRRTYDEVMAQEIVDLVVLVDDGSCDETVSIARTLPHTIVCVHDDNRGYGANQKSCYRLALEAGGDIIIMVHPDYQYTPQLIPAMSSMIGNGLVSMCAWLQNSRRICFERRNAHLEVYCQSISNFDREYFAGSQAVRVSHRIQGIFQKTSEAADA